MKKQLLNLMTLCISIIGYSQTFTDNFITYNVTSTSLNTVAVTGYNTAGGTSVNIPATVTNNSVTYSITSFAQFSLSSKGLISVSIPNSVTHIGQQAFENNNLSSITIPNSVLVIGNFAFQINQLTSITIPSNVTSIGNGAFRGNNSLTSVTSLATTPPTITTVSNSNDTFFNSISGNRGNIDLFIPSGTTGVYVTDAGALWTGFNSVTELLNVGDTFVVDFITYEITSVSPDTVEAIDYNTAGGTVVDMPATLDYNSTTYTVTSIKFDSFNNKNLTTAIIPNTVTEIGSNAFAFNQLNNVIIPDNITVISSGAFSFNNLTSITIPENVVNIQAQAFKSNSITDVISMSVTPPNLPVSGSVSDAFDNHNNINLIIPNGTTDDYAINSGALWVDFKLVFEITSVTPNTLKVTNYNSASGTSINIPATITDASVVYNVTEIGDSVFFSKGLTSVTIPNSVTNIGISAFNTNSLTSVTIPDSVITIGAQAFVTNSLTNLIIGNNVTIIGLGAFADNDLTSITIPSSVTNIDPIAFAANPLTDVFSESITPPTITTGTNDTFHITGDRSGIHLHIPAGTMGAYVTDAGALWTGFNPVSEDALSVEDFELVNAIKVITTNDAIKIVYSSSVRLQNYTIYSITGAKVTTGTENDIPTNYLANGIYILKLDFDKGTVVKKVVVN